MTETIHKMWEDILCLQCPLSDTNFFDLGGTSLDLIALRARLKEATGVNVRMVDFFRYPTLVTLAGHVIELAHGGRRTNGERNRM